MSESRVIRDLMEAERAKAIADAEALRRHYELEVQVRVNAVRLDEHAEFSRTIGSKLDLLANQVSGLVANRVSASFPGRQRAAVPEARHARKSCADWRLREED
jgi:hypothetical protein